MTCPITEDIPTGTGHYHLTCVLPQGHSGEHWAAEVEWVDDREDR